MIEALVIVEFQGEVPPEWPADPPEEAPRGFLGSSIWTGLGTQATALRLAHYADGESARAHLRDRIERTDRPPVTRDVPPEVHHVVLKSRHGKALESAAPGGFLTTVHLVAAPGYGRDAAEELDRTLESLELLEGFAGSARGYNVALEDENWALVFWNSPPDVAPPADGGSTVAHYRRVS